MQSLKAFVHDLQEAKAAAEAHNLAPSPGSLDPLHPPPPPPPPPAVLSTTSTTSTALSTDPAAPAAAADATNPQATQTTPQIKTTTLEISSDRNLAHETPHLHQQLQYSPGFPPPPPPPRDLPIGWTARFDPVMKKYAYSEGVTGVEQWDFPTDTKQLSQLPSTLLHHHHHAHSRKISTEMGRDGSWNYVPEKPTYVPAEHPPISAGVGLGGGGGGGGGVEVGYVPGYVEIAGKGKGKAT